ncbi:MAG: transcriptional regulator [Spirochaetia bacterium]|jgi:TfoX/Sxy family transcriptional regulator of competence genes|nr:transcriptional regulator [Spirochaetia bacterium]
MSTTQDYIDYVFDQIDSYWNKRYKKMFGEYMVYINEKPLLLVCNNTVYIKVLECFNSLIPADRKGFPYEGSKEHYIVDIDDKIVLNAIITELEKVIPIPVRKQRNKSS